jgi:peptide/nickel transport system substrate-binding protein
MPSDGAAYTSFINSNGFVQYFGAPYATRMAEAAKIMDRYVPNWKNEPVVVNFLHRNNARRTAQCNLYAASLIKVGFKITCGGRADWSSQTRNVSYDVGLFAWGAGLPQQTGDCAQVKSASPNSTWGWKNGRIDGYCAYLEGGPLLESSKLRSWANIEKEVALNAYSLPLFQWPGIVAVNSDLKGVKPSPITPNLVWNYWEWTY